MWTEQDTELQKQSLAEWHAAQKEAVLRKKIAKLNRKSEKASKGKFASNMQPKKKKRK